MFAYVKYDDGHKKTVPTSDIKHFNPKEINYTKKYKILWEEEYYDGIIITVGDTAEKVDEIVSTKRQTVPQMKFCESASSETDTDNQLQPQKQSKNSNTKEILKKKMDQMRLPNSTAAKNVVREDTGSSPQPLGEKNTGNKVGAGIKSRAKVVSIKIPEKKIVVAKKNKQLLLPSTKKQIEKPKKEAPKKTSGQKIDESTTAKEVTTSENDESQSMSKTNNNSKSGEHEVVLEEDKLGTNVTKGESTYRAEISLTGVKNLTEKKKPPTGRGQKAAHNASDRILDMNDESLPMSKAADNVQKSSEPQDVAEDENLGPDSTKGPQSKSSTTGVKNSSEKKKSATDLRQEVLSSNARGTMSDANNNGVKILKDKLKEMNLENARLKKCNAEYIRVQRDLKDQLKEVTNLNMKLQETVIKSQETVAAELEHLRSVMGDVKQLRGPLNVEQLHSAGDAPVRVGYRRLDKKLIHIGQDEWITITNYNTIASTSKTPGQFARQMACAVFGTPLLRMSSVTGAVSNRTRANNPVPRPALDPTKLLAIKDILRYWLIEKKKYGEVAADLEANLVGTHIGAKICDLNRKLDDEAPNANPESDVEDGSDLEIATANDDLSNVEQIDYGEEVLCADLCEAEISSESNEEAVEPDEIET